MLTIKFSEPLPQFHCVDVANLLSELPNIFNYIVNGVLVLNYINNLDHQKT